MSDFLNEMLKEVSKTQKELLDDNQSRSDQLVEMIEHSLYCIESFLQIEDDGDNSFFVVFELIKKSYHTTRALLLLCYSGFEFQCLSLIRDLIETEYLIEYFLKKPEKMVSWISSDEKTIMRNYSPKKLRKKIAADNIHYKKILDQDYSGHSKFLHVTPDLLKIQKGYNIMNNGNPNSRFARACLSEIAYHIGPIAGTSSELGLLFTKDKHFDKNELKLKRLTKSLKFFQMIGKLPIMEYLEKGKTFSKNI